MGPCGTEGTKGHQEGVEGHGEHGPTRRRERTYDVAFVCAVPNKAPISTPSEETP